MSERTLYTLGHSNREAGEFLELVEAADLGGVADVRTYPSSRRFPWANEGNLRDALEAEGVAYRHLERLGGLRDEPDPDPSIEGVPEKWRPYAAHLQTDEFADGLDMLLELADNHGPVAFMCAERDPSRCHRQFIADVLVLHDYEVVHLIHPGESFSHEVRDEAEPTDDGRVIYPSDQRNLPL
jgi:uncharacterized protein (DUF488 family)